MTSLNLVTDRVVVSDESGGPHVPGSSPQDIQQHIDALFDDELEDSIIDLKERIDAAHTELLMRVAAFDERSIAESKYRLSTIGWLHDHCRIPPREASGKVKTAQALVHMPTITSNALEGRVPYRSVQLLSQTRDKHPDEFLLHEAVFADTATYLTSADLGQDINVWEQEVDYDQAESDTRTRDLYRSLYFAAFFDGLTDIEGSLTPEVAHTVITALDALCDPGNLDPDDHRTLPQQRHDALGEISRFFLDNNTSVVTSGGEKPHITITVPYEILTGDKRQLPEIDHVPVTPETIRRLLCDASVVRIVTHGESQPLDIGRRTRTIPPALRRALELRDGGCTWQGCGAPVSWCDAHHIIHWANGGETSLENLILLCRRHHTTTHEQDRAPPDHRSLKPAPDPWITPRPANAQPQARPLESRPGSP